MKRQINSIKMIAIIIGILALFTIAIFFITNSPKEQPSIFTIAKFNDDHDNEPHRSHDIQKSISEISDEIIEALHERSMSKISPYVHPDKGVTISPYVLIVENAPVFHKEELKNLFQNDEKIYWGIYDGKGTDINLTPSEYFEQFIQSELYIHADEVNMNKINENYNTESNILDIFPQAQTIEYYDDGTEEFAGIDWESIILVFEPSNAGGFYLVGLIGNRWTI